MYFTEFVTKYISKYSVEGVLEKNIVPFIHSTSDVKIDKDDNIYVSTNGGGVKKISADLSTIEDIGTLEAVWAMAINPDGELIWGVNDGDKVVKYNTSLVLTGTPTNADVGTHNIVLTLTDGEIATPVEQAFTITVTKINSEPTITIADAILNYTENDAATPIYANATANDADGDADWNGGTLTVQITANNEADDKITIPDNATGINTSGTNLLNESTVIGTLSASEGTVTNGTMLTITFNGNVTNALVQELVRAIAYESTSEDPGTSDRTVTFTVTDANAASASDTRTIAVIAEDDAPTITTNSGLSLDEGVTKGIPLDSLEADDTDTDNSTLVYTITSGPSKGQLENTDNASTAITSFTQQNLADGKIQYVHDGTNTTSDAFTFKVSDGTNELTDQSFSITVIAVDDDAPTIVTNTTLDVNNGESAIITSTSHLSSTDAEDVEASLVYTVTSAPLNGQLENTDNGGLAITSVTQQNLIDGKIRYVHNGTSTISDVFTFKVADTNNNELVGVTFDIDVAFATELKGNQKVNIKLYPNPAQDVLYVSYDEFSDGVFEILDLTGKLFLQGALSQEGIDIRSLTEGMYILRVSLEGNSEIYRFSKK